MAAVTSAGRASGLEPLELGADSVAAAALFERHSTHVFRYCNARLGRREDAEDAVQTTFLYAVRSLRRGVKPLVESAWLLGIARNVCLSRWEASGRRNRLEAVCDPHELGRTAAAPQGRREELIGLEDALARLPERQRRAVLLRDWRGLSYDEVAEQLGVSRAAVETLIFRGRERLAELLREEPSTIRRRLTSLGNLGTLVTAVKSAFAGGAAATKVAVAVTAVAVSGAGIVAGPLLGGGRGGDAPAPSGSVGARPSVAPAPLPEVPASASAPTRAEPLPAASVPAATQPARTAGITPPARRAPELETAPGSPIVPVPAAAPVNAPAAPRPTSARDDRSTATPVAPVVNTPQVPEPLPTVTTAVGEIVTAVVTDLPVVAVPELPVVEPVVETVIGSLPVLPVSPQAVVPALLPVALPPLLP